MISLSVSVPLISSVTKSKSRSASPDGRSWTVIREGNIKNRNGTWCGKVESTLSAADRDGPTSKSDNISMRYTTVNSDGKRSVEEKKYVAKEADDKTQPCPHCHLAGHRPYGCMQKGDKA